MPLSTVLPPPQIELVDQWSAPSLTVGIGSGSAGNMSVQPKVFHALDHLTADYQIAGGTSGVSTWTTQGGDRLIWRAAGAPAGARALGWVTRLAEPSLAPAADFNPGAQAEAGSVVVVHNCHFRLSGAAADYGLDATGFFFTSRFFGSNAFAQRRLGSAPQVGYGIFANDDGAGAARWEYLTWNGAVATERVPVPVGVVPDVTAWSTVRFIVVGSAAGREATLTVEVNGVELVARTFGTPELPRFDAIDATAIGFFWAFGLDAINGAALDFCFDGFNGRFLPDGTEVQPLTL